MRKATLEGNILPRAKQRFLVEGMPGADIQYISRDVIPMEIGVIELPDQTRVPGGRRRAGEFTLTLQFGRNQDREAYLAWFNLCIDRGDRGISPAYKRNARLIYLRLFQGSPGTYNSGSDLPPVEVNVIGCWPSSMQLPDYDMTGDEGDGDTNLECTLNFDDVELVQQMAGILG
jgi:hypothetical protein